MPQENCQKTKLLKLMEILRQETDEDHPLSICRNSTKTQLTLSSANVKCGRIILKCNGDKNEIVRNN